MQELIKFLKLPIVKTVFVLYFIFNIFTVCSVSTASLSDVQLCTSVNGDGECDKSKSEFSSGDAVIYCSAKLKSAPSSTKVTFTWKYEDEVLGKVDVETGSAVVYSNYKSPGSLKPGKYSVTVKINTDNSDPVTKSFTVVE